MDFERFFESMIYKEATHDMEAKAQYKLANWLAHGYEIEHSRKTVTIVERKGELIMVDRQGNIWTAQGAI